MMFLPLLMLLLIPFLKMHMVDHPLSLAKKRAKTIDLDGDPLVVAFTSSSERIAITIEKLATGNMDLPSYLYTILKSLPGFNSAHISFYYTHLVANLHVGRAFYNLPFYAKIEWVVDFITQRFLGMAIRVWVPDTYRIRG
jgi:hypothetical protein